MRLRHYALIGIACSLLSSLMPGCREPRRRPEEVFPLPPAPEDTEEPSPPPAPEPEETTEEAPPPPPSSAPGAALSQEELFGIVSGRSDRIVSMELPELHPVEHWPEDLLITLERTSCLGSCPAYTLRIDAHGEVEFSATRWSRSREGRGRIRRSAIAELLGGFEHLGFEQLGRLPCGLQMTDAPSVRLHLRRDGREHTVSDYHGCFPPLDTPSIHGPLREFERRIDELAGTERWLGPREARSSIPGGPHQPRHR